MAVTIDEQLSRRQHNWLGWLTSRQAFWVFVAVIIAGVFLTFATDSFATPNNLYNVTRNVTFVAIVALGMTIVIITGGIDLSVGSVLCLCSMVLAVVMHLGFSIWTGITASILTALAIGLFNGVLIAYLDMPPFVVTLGMFSIARSVVRPGSKQAAHLRRRIDLRHCQSGSLYDRTRAPNRFPAALDEVRPSRLRHRRQ